MVSGIPGREGSGIWLPAKRTTVLIGHEKCLVARFRSARGIKAQGAFSFDMFAIGQFEYPSVGSDIAADQLG
jgi:hypothetical protein